MELLGILKPHWETFRRKYCPKRIYSYGTCGLGYFDDRTQLEKMCDVVDDWFYEQEQEARSRKGKEKVVWHTYHDKLLNMRIDSPEILRKMEKKGYAYCKPHELDEAASKGQRYREEQINRRIEKKVNYAYEQVKQGRSYIREQRERMEKLKRK